MAALGSHHGISLGRGRGEPLTLSKQDTAHYLAGVLSFLRTVSTQHVPGEYWQNVEAPVPLEQLQADVVQL